MSLDRLLRAARSDVRSPPPSPPVLPPIVAWIPPHRSTGTSPCPSAGPIRVASRCSRRRPRAAHHDIHHQPRQASDSFVTRRRPNIRQTADRICPWRIAPLPGTSPQRQGECGNRRSVVMRSPVSSTTSSNRPGTNREHRTAAGRTSTTTPRPHLVVSRVRNSEVDAGGHVTSYHDLSARAAGCRGRSLAARTARSRVRWYLGPHSSRTDGVGHHGSVVDVHVP